MLVKTITVFQGDFLPGEIFQLYYYFFNHVLCGLLGGEFLRITEIIILLCKCLVQISYEFHLLKNMANN